MGYQPEKIIGKVKWFNASKGFGFITRDDNKQDVFVHHTNITMEGFRDLTEGQPVAFVVNDTPKGPAAVLVEKI